MSNDKWPEATLGDHVDLLSGFAFKSKQFTNNPEDIPLVKGANVHQGFIDWETAKRWPTTEVNGCEKFFLEPGDVVLAMDRPWIEAGLKWAWIRPEHPKSLLVQRVSRMRGLSDLDTGFLRYIVGSQQFTGYIRPIVTGVNVPHISGNQIKGFTFRLPPLTTQRKIASILSAYDDLIANNTRRIAILEEMAQAIYREWFVNFRFPGHENVKLVDSPLGQIPEGWEVGTLEDMCLSVNDGDWIETKDQGGEDYRLLQVSNIGTASFRETGNYRYITQETYERLRCQEVVPGDILISRMPTPIGRAWLVNEMPWKMITAVDVAIAKPKMPSHAAFILCYLNSDAHLDLAEKHATGTTRPRVSRRALCGLKTANPPSDSKIAFDDYVESMFSLAASLRNKNHNLRTTRDLLLPKLISGELDVEDLDIDVGQSLEELVGSPS